MLGVEPERPHQGSAEREHLCAHAGWGEVGKVSTGQASKFMDMGNGRRAVWGAWKAGGQEWPWELVPPEQPGG